MGICCTKTDLLLVDADPSEVNVGAVLLGSSVGQQKLRMTFKKDGSLTQGPVVFDDSNIYISFQRQAPGVTQDISYGANGASNVKFPSEGAIMSEPLSLAKVGDAGFFVGDVTSLKVFVCYGSALEATIAAPPFMKDAAGRDVKVRTAEFELTTTGGGPCADMTAINFFTAPMALTTKKVDGKAIETKAYTLTTAQISEKLRTLTKPDAVVKNDKGEVVRYIGPSSFGVSSTGGYQTFQKYLEYLRGPPAIPASINRSQDYPEPRPNLPAPNPIPTGFQPVHNYTLYSLHMVLTATVDNSLSINLTGKVVCTSQDYQWNSSTKQYDLDGSKKTEEVDHCDVKLDGSNQQHLACVIYGQSEYPSLKVVTFSDKGWPELKKLLMKKPDGRMKGLDEQVKEFTHKRDSTAEEKNQVEKVEAEKKQVAAWKGQVEKDLEDYKRSVIGEITCGLVGGFLGSEIEVDGEKIKDMDSSRWWELEPMKAFSACQPGEAKKDYYNQYADVIYTASGNHAYSVPYSDRFHVKGKGPDLDLGPDVAELEVTIYEPVS